MVSRRTFLGASAIAVVAAASRVDPLSATPPIDEARELPPSIRALQSMQDQATPISVEERAARIAKAQRLMQEHGIDAIMLTGGTTLNYFTNVRWGLSERLFALILPVRGRAFVVSPAFEEDRAREQLDTGPLNDTEVLTWEEDGDPYTLVKSGLAARGIASGRLGIEAAR